MPILTFYAMKTVRMIFCGLKTAILSDQATTHILVMGFGMMFIYIGGAICTLIFFRESLSNALRFKNKLDSLYKRKSNEPPS